MDEIDNIVLLEQFESINATVEEKLNNDKLNLVFKIFEDEKIFIDRINIYGNDITAVISFP